MSFFDTFRGKKSLAREMDLGVVEQKDLVCIRRWMNNSKNSPVSSSFDPIILSPRDQRWINARMGYADTLPVNLTHRPSILSRVLSRLTGALDDLYLARLNSRADKLK